MRYLVRCRTITTSAPALAGALPLSAADKRQAERLIRTLLTEWEYATAYGHSARHHTTSSDHLSGLTFAHRSVNNIPVIYS